MSVSFPWWGDILFVLGCAGGGAVAALLYLSWLLRDRNP